MEEINNKKIIIIVSLVAVFLIALTLILLNLFRDNNGTAGIGEDEKKTIIKGKDNENIETESLYDITKEEITDKDVFIAKSEQYEIIFFDYNGEKGFIVLIKEGDPVAVRINAEEALLRELNIAKEKACNLDVSLYVTKEVDEKLADKNYGLSFCPDGKAFDEIKGL